MKNKILKILKSIFLNLLFIFIGGIFFIGLFVSAKIIYNLRKEPESWITDTATIHWVSDLKQVKDKLDEASRYSNAWVNGVMSGDADNCIIWAYEPRDKYDIHLLNTLGHEVLHCFRGHFHD